MLAVHAVRAWCVSMSRKSCFLLALVVGCAAMVEAAEAPVLREVRLNRGAAQTPVDAVLIDFTFDHPAAPAQPIPFYRARTKSPDAASWPAWGDYVENTRGTNEFTMFLTRRNGSTPIPGEHWVEVQLRDAYGSESNVLAASIVRVVAPTPSPMVDYRVTRDAPIVPAFADQHGFKFEPVNLNPRTTDCRLELEPRFVFAAVPRQPLVPTGSVPPPGPCQLRMFMYGTLQPGWALKSVSFQPQTEYAAVIVTGPLTGSGSDAAMTIELRSSNPDPGVQPAVSVTLGELVFEGPRGGGRSWRDAFRRP